MCSSWQQELIEAGVTELKFIWFLLREERTSVTQAPAENACTTDLARRNKALDNKGPAGQTHRNPFIDVGYLVHPGAWKTFVGEKTTARE